MYILLFLTWGRVFDFDNFFSRFLLVLQNYGYYGYNKFSQLWFYQENKRAKIQTSNKRFCYKQKFFYYSDVKNGIGPQSI